jgi:hypothetical protein
MDIAYTSAVCSVILIASGLVWSSEFKLYIVWSTKRQHRDFEGRILLDGSVLDAPLIKQADGLLERATIGNTQAQVIKPDTVWIETVTTDRPLGGWGKHQKRRAIVEQDSAGRASHACR